MLYFRNLQLSWNPALSSYRVTTHSSWPSTQGPKNDTFNVGENPQHIMELSQDALQKKATIWVLISRHVTKQEQEGCEVRSKNSFTYLLKQKHHFSHNDLRPLAF